MADKNKSALSAWDIDISHTANKETNNNGWKSGQVLLLDTIELVGLLQWTIWMVLAVMHILVTQLKHATKRPFVEGK